MTTRLCIDYCMQERSWVVLNFCRVDMVYSCVHFAKDKRQKDEHSDFVVSRPFQAVNWKGFATKDKQSDFVLQGCSSRYAQQSPLSSTNKLEGVVFE